MKFTVDQSVFFKALTTSARSLQIRANLPILSNFLITAKGQGVEILSTDLETATRASVNCKVEKEGSTTVSGKTFLEFISQLSEGDVGVEKLGEELVVSAKGYSARFATISPDEFPAIPQIEKGLTLTLQGTSFASAVERVAFAAAQDEGRPILTGVFLEVGKGKLTMVATDGYRLSFEQLPLPAKAQTAAVKIVVPARALVEIGKIILEQNYDLGEGKGAEVKINIAGELNQMGFKTEKSGKVGVDIEYTSRLIEGEYPAWQKIIPSTFATRVKIARLELMKLVKVAAIFARESGNIVKLKISKQPAAGKGIVSVGSQSSQIGSSDASCETDITGDGGEIAFNWRYVVEALSAIDSQDIVFEMNESLNPGRITGDGADSFFHIIMPVRLQG